MTTAKLAKLVETHNSKNPPEYALKVKGSSNVEMPSTLMTSFFLPLVENIKTKVRQLFQQAEAKNETIDFIFMVGGFSESPFLKNEIIKRFENDKVQVRGRNELALFNRKIGISPKKTSNISR